MGKGRKKVLSDEAIDDIIDAFSLDDTLTKREIAYRYRVSASTIYNILPQYLKESNVIPKKVRKEVYNPGG